MQEHALKKKKQHEIKSFLKLSKAKFISLLEIVMHLTSAWQMKY